MTVPESAYDYAEIIRRGGANGGDEDFILIKCPHCGELHLHDMEIDTVFPDPDDLSRRQAVDLSYPDSFRCVGCAQPFPGDAGDPIWDVTWDDVVRSRWAWVIRPSAWPLPQKGQR